MQSIIVLIPRGKHLAGAKMHYVSPVQLMNTCSLCSYIVIYQGSPQSELYTAQTLEKNWEEPSGVWWKSGVGEEGRLGGVYLSWERSLPLSLSLFLCLEYRQNCCLVCLLP